MKGLGTVLLIIFLLLGVYIVHEYFDTMTPAWQTEAAAKAVMNVQDYSDELRNEAQRRAWFTQFWPVAFTALLCVLVAGAGVYYWRIIDERTESKNRMVDGSFALTTFRNAQGQAYLVDPNKGTFGVFGFNKNSGELITDASMIGPDRQLAYVQAIQKTRTAQAQPISEIRNSAQAKYASGFYDRPQRTLDYELDIADEDQPAQLTAFTPLTAQDAFNQSSATKWILGQSPTTGELFELNPKQASHFGIVGASGSGKTGYTALMLMAYALKNKYRVVILDGKGGADWSKYAHLVEYFALDYANVGELVAQIVSEYQKRQTLLNQHQANSIWELPSGITKPRPTLFIVDEFGAVMDGLKAAKSRREIAEFDLAFGNLLRLSRAAGLYVILCDQNPSKWPGTVRANMPMNLAYRLGGGIGGAVNEYNLDRLDRVGQFQVSNTVYNAFKTYDVINQLLPDASYQKPVALLTVAGSELRTGSDREGGVEAQNPPPTRTSSEPVLTSSTREPDQVLPSSEPVLTGSAVSSADKELVLRTHARTGNKTATCKAVWGRKNGVTWAWLNEVLDASEAQRTAHEQPGNSSATHLDTLRSTYGHDIYINGEKLGIDITQRTDKLL